MNTQRIADVVHPGTHLSREMNARGWSQPDLAEILDRPIQAVNQILNGRKGITPATARELEEATKISAETWLNLESQYRLSLADRRDDAVARRAELFSRAPVADMRRRGWIRDSRDIDELNADVMQLLRIESLSEPPQLRFAARKATGYNTIMPEQEAWCSQAFQMADRMKGLPRFSKKRFESSLEDLRNLGQSLKTVKRMPNALGKLGIRLVVVEHLPRTKIDGATFWLSKTRPVVALSLRYGRMDHFLFTLFHELMHVRYQDALSLDSDILKAGRDEDIPECEVRANEEAAALLVPHEELKQFVKENRGRIGKAEIIRFGSDVGMHPAVVLGQLQHRGIVGWSACRELLVSVRDTIAKAANTNGWGFQEKA